MADVGSAGCCVDRQALRSAPRRMLTRNQPLAPEDARFV